jgi:hypothetical protein
LEGVTIGSSLAIHRAKPEMNVPPSMARPVPFQGDLRNLPDGLAPLKAFPNWVCWRWEWKINKKGVGKWDKPPINPRDRNSYARNNDPKTWGTYEDALAAFDAGSCDGIGFNLQNTRIAAFDIDKCRDRETGSIAPEALELVNRATSYTECTVSGTGLRVIGYGGDKKIHRKQKLPNSPVEVESYSSAERYIVITGKPLNGSWPHIAGIGPVMDDVVAELDRNNVLDLAAKRSEKAQGTAEAALPAALQALIDNPPPDADQSRQFHHAVCWLGDLGWSGGKIEAYVTGKPIVPDRFARRLRNEIDRCLQKARLKSPTNGAQIVDGVSLDDFYAYMPTHSYMFAPSREMWPASSVNSRIAPIDIGDEKTIQAAAWLDQNKPVEQMTWAPGLSMLIQNRLISEGGWIERKGVSCFNLYRPPAIVAGDAAKAGPWLNHIRKVFGDDANHIVQWLAHRVQRPNEKINHAIVLGGSQGIGKDTLLEPVKQAIGPWNFVEASPQQMLGRFNGFLKSVILRVSEARDLGDVDRFKFYDHLKAYTAAPPDVLRVDEKHLREHSVLNVCGVIITTNHKTDGIYLPTDDRRHFVAWSDLAKEDFTPAYWDDLWGWYAASGNCHVAAYLAGLDLSTFNAKAPPPKTAAFWEIVDANRAPEDAEIADTIDLLGNPPATTIDRIATMAEAELQCWIRDRKNRRQIPHRMEECGYVRVRNEAAKDGLWVINGKRQVIYARNNLSIRDRIDAAGKLANQCNQ